MTAGILVDVGPLVAILHRNDRDHVRCVEALKGLREPLLTTWIPITEAMYLLSFSPDAQDALRASGAAAGLWVQIRSYSIHSHQAFESTTPLIS